MARRTRPLPPPPPHPQAQQPPHPVQHVTLGQLAPGIVLGYPHPPGQPAVLRPGCQSPPAYCFFPYQCVQRHHQPRVVQVFDVLALLDAPCFFTMLPPPRTKCSFQPGPLHIVPAGPGCKMHVLGRALALGRWNGDLRKVLTGPLPEFAGFLPFQLRNGPTCIAATGVRFPYSPLTSRRRSPAWGLARPRTNAAPCGRLCRGAGWFTLYGGGVDEGADGTDRGEMNDPTRKPGTGPHSGNRRKIPAHPWAVRKAGGPVGPHI